MRMVSVFGLLLLAACGAEREPQPAPEPLTEVADPVARPAGQTEAQFAAAVAAIREEPKVRDLLHQPTEAVEWHVGVFDDGTPRNGYAEYICQVIKDAGAMTDRTNVRIVDIAAVNSGSDFRTASLGHVDCATGQAIRP